MVAQFLEAGALVESCPVQPAHTFAFRLWKCLRVRRPDAVVAHVGVVSGLILLVARLAEIPIRIAHMHSDRDGREDTLPRRLMRSLLRSMMRWSATEVVGVTAASVAFAGPRAGDPRYRVLPNGIDLTRFARVRIEAGSPPGDGPTFVHIGRAAPEKNRAFLLPVHAFARQVAPTARLVVVGPGGVADLEVARPDVVDDKFIDLVGETSEVERYLAAADVLLLPSVREGLPGVVLQALTAGVPVIATDLPGIRGIAEIMPGITLLALDRDPSEWAQAALEAAAMTEEDRRCISDAMCVSHFNLNLYAERWRAMWAGRAW